MTNLDVINMKHGEFSAAYERAKVSVTEKKHINTSISFDEQLTRFEAAAFSDEEARALQEDLLSI